jgi:GH18 family chitinase
MKPGRAADTAKTMANFTRAGGYDGLDLDLEGSAVNEDYEDFALALGNELRAPGERALGYSAAVGARPADEPFLIKACLDSFDWVNLMLYDMAGPWDPTTPKQHAPLEFVRESLAAYKALGLPPEKLVVGLPLYGYGYGSSYRKDAYGWKDIASRWPRYKLSDFAKTDAFGSGIYYNGFDTIGAKTALALNEAGGIMFWQIGADSAGGDSLTAWAASLCRPAQPLR